MSAQASAMPEEIKTALVDFSQRLGDAALEGKIIGCTIVLQTDAGALEVTHTGISAPHAVGMLQLALNMVIAKTLGGNVK